MRKIAALTACLILLPTMACSQPVAQPTPVLPPGTVQLTITLSEAELIWKAIRKLPVEEVEVLMPKIRQQVQEQTQPKELSK